MKNVFGTAHQTCGQICLPSTWQGLPKDVDGYVQKTVFWHDGFDTLSEPNPDLTASGRRLDPSTTSFLFSDAMYGWDETGGFMLMGISIPTEGCWEITAEYLDAQLSFIVLVTLSFQRNSSVLKKFSR